MNKKLLPAFIATLFTAGLFANANAADIIMTGSTDNSVNKTTPHEEEKGNQENKTPPLTFILPAAAEKTKTPDTAKPDTAETAETGRAGALNPSVTINTGNACTHDRQDCDDAQSVPADYTGKAEEKVYSEQEQYPVNLYGTFSAKIHLIPDGGKISYFLSEADKKSWQVALLPGNILRITRAENEKARPTDLFIISSGKYGNKTYTFILQSVTQPSERTDSLRFVKAVSAGTKTTGFSSQQKAGFSGNSK